MESQIRKESPYGEFSSYRLRCFIVKGGDDLRQEMMMMQVIKKMKDIFEQEKCDAWLGLYEIIVFSDDSGMVEFCKDSISIDGLKK